jgi:hypothetical protein
MGESFSYKPTLIRDAQRLWDKSGYIPSKNQMDALIAMPEDERHTFINDLVAFESVVTTMKTMTPLIDDRIKLLVSKRQYDAARKLAKSYPDDPKAQQYLQDIDTLETPVERGAKSAVKYIAWAALALMVIMIGLAIFTILYLNR